MFRLQQQRRSFVIAVLRVSGVFECCLFIRKFTDRQRDGESDLTCVSVVMYVVQGCAAVCAVGESRDSDT